MNTETFAYLAEHGVFSEWVTADLFCKATGQKKSTLSKKCLNKWTQGLVWKDLAGHERLYSIKGFNQWVSQQNIRQGLECEMAHSKSTSNGTKKGTMSPSRLKQTRRASEQLSVLETI